MTVQNTAVVTGSTGGIGQEISRRLADQGWNLILINRDREKAKSQIDSLREDYPDQRFQSYLANLLDAEEVRQVASQISNDNVDVQALYNVAGLLTDHRTTSPQNVEGHFAVNTLAPYLLSRGLRDRLADGAASRSPSVIVNFSSSAIKGVKTLDVAGLVDTNNNGGLMGAYAESKMALTISTFVLADEYREDGILAVAVDPGATKTPMTSTGDGMPWFIKLLVPILFKSAEVQARRIVEGVESAVRDKKSGLLIVEGRRKPMPSMASDPDIRSELKSLLDTLAATQTP